MNTGRSAAAAPLGPSARPRDAARPPVTPHVHYPPEVTLLGRNTPEASNRGVRRSIAGHDQDPIRAADTRTRVM